MLSFPHTPVVVAALALYRERRSKHLMTQAIAATSYHDDEMYADSDSRLGEEDVVDFEMSPPCPSFPAKNNAAKKNVLPEVS